MKERWFGATRRISPSRIQTKLQRSRLWLSLFYAVMRQSIYLIEGVDRVV